MRLFSIFPLLSIPVVLYNLMALFAGAAVKDGGFAAQLAKPVFSVSMVRGGVFALASGDLLIILALALLFVELIKATGTGATAIVNHALSMVLFIVCLIEFLLLPGFGTAAFFVISLMTLLDVLAGVVVTIVSARRDVTVEEDGRH